MGVTEDFDSHSRAVGRNGRCCLLSENRKEQALTYKHDKNRTSNEFHAIRLLRSGSVRYHLTNLSTSVERM